MKTLHQKLVRELALYEHQQGLADDQNYATDNLSMCMLWSEIKHDYLQPWVAAHYHRGLIRDTRDWYHLSKPMQHSLIISEIMKEVRAATA